MSDAPDHLNDLSAAVERLAPLAADEGRPVARSSAERALASVLATVLGGLALAALGGLTGALSLGVATVVAGLLAAGAAGWGLLRLGELDERREEAAAATRERARQARDAARGDVLRAVDGVVAHIDGLAAERTQLHGRIDRLERRLSAKERKLSRLQAFDAERRTLEPAPADDPMAGQMTFDADG